jgi:hypothetical protein
MDHPEQEQPPAGEPSRPQPPLGAAAERRPRFDDPEQWHDLAERGTPRNG